MPSGESLQALLKKHRAARSKFLDRKASLSWARVLVSLVSYALLLTDVLRTGPGIRRTLRPRLHSDEVMLFGPYAYPGAHLLANETDGGVLDNWMYKYDSTSIVFRAYAEHFQLQSWPPCLLYKSACATPTLDRRAVFQMLDSLVGTVANLKSARRPRSLTLRMTYRWFDRLHHYVLPWFFNSDIQRTVQALYYDAKLLRSPTFAFCSPHTASAPQPYACQDFWTNVAPNCPQNRSPCDDVGRLFQHALARYRSLQKRYANTTLDVVVLESVEDPNGASFTYHGRSMSDIVIVARVRDCKAAQDQASNGCSTIAIDDYRYESTTLNASVEDWFIIAAGLRTVGQAYAWVRLGLLFVGCVVARASEPKFVNATLAVRIPTGLRTMFLIPSQVVVYGSVFPIACYVIAHVLDSAVTYDIVSQAFSTVLGVFDLNVGEFLRLCAVLMRSIWVIASVVRALAFVRSSRNVWSASSGVEGVPELAISFMSCLTVMALFRSRAFRDTRITSISHVVPSARIASLRRFSYGRNRHNVWWMLLHSNPLDAKCVLAAAGVHLAVFSVTWCCVHVWGRVRRSHHLTLLALPRSQVSYAAGTLWPAGALMVSWSGALSHEDDGANAGINAAYTQLKEPGPLQPLHHQSREVANSQPAKRAWMNKVSFGGSVRVFPGVAQRTSHPPRRHKLALLDERDSDDEALVFLMNLAMLTDPITLLSVRWIRDHTVCVLRSRVTDRVYLIPESTLKSHHLDIPIHWDDFERVATVSARDLPFQDLLHCG